LALSRFIFNSNHQQDDFSDTRTLPKCDVAVKHFREKVENNLIRPLEAIWPAMDHGETDLLKQ